MRLSYPECFAEADPRLRELPTAALINELERESEREVVLD